MLLYTIGIFKSYPGYGDVGLMFALLPLWKHVYQCKASSFFVCSVKAYEQIYKLLNKSCSLFTDMRNTFVTVCMFLVCTVFAPIQYYLWIYAGSANANFYFAISLAFSTAQVFHILLKLIMFYIYIHVPTCTCLFILEVFTYCGIDREPIFFDRQFVIGLMGKGCYFLDSLS